MRKKTNMIKDKILINEFYPHVIDLRLWMLDVSFKKRISDTEFIQNYYKMNDYKVHEFCFVF